MYTRGRVPSLFIRSYHSTADQLNSNTKQKVQPTTVIASTLQVVATRHGQQAQCSSELAARVDARCGGIERDFM